MDIDADDHGEEGIPLPGMDAHAMQMVIIEYPVVYPFARMLTSRNFTTKSAHFLSQQSAIKTTRFNIRS